MYGIGALLILGFMCVLWIVSLALRNSSIVDIFWGPGFVLANWVYFVLTPASVVVLAVVWLAERVRG